MSDARTNGHLLELDDVHTYYGNIRALRGVSIHVDHAEIVTLIGSNGAGKSTTLKTISGVLKPRQGQVRLGVLVKGLLPRLRTSIGYGPKSVLTKQ